MGLPHVTSIVRPSSVEAALNLLKNGNGAARLLAGGVDIVRQPPSGDITLVDVSALPLRDIAVTEDGQAISIGATATLTEIMESKLIVNLYHGELIAMLGRVASPLLRNLATIGGSIGSSHPWSDIHCLLLALGAKVEVYDGSYRTVDLADIAPRPRQDQLFTRVLIPIHGNGTAVAFETFSLTKFDVAMLNCACSISIVAGKVVAARVVAGGTPARASRIHAAEERLLGTELDAASIQHATDAAVSDTGLRDDVRASAEYRRVLLKTGIRRCLLRARARTALGSKPLS
ncbi:FAD binding domain-containing protein [Candidatus Bipolaricaulota bacterium]|nr:FAD binding domain-containing protein [Candidatus Bipolaricaulota bacterium]